MVLPPAPPDFYPHHTLPMPISFTCTCGKTLQVKDEFAGRRVRCPACNGVATAPAGEPEFEVVDDPAPRRAAAPPPPPPAKAVPVRANPVERSRDDDWDDEDDRPRKRRRDDDEDDRPRGKRRDEEDDDDRPRKRRDDEEDDDEDRPRKKYKPKKPAKKEQASHFGMEKGILNGGVAGGLLAMLIAVVWCVLGIVLIDRFFFYTPILFVLGLIAFIKGLVGGGSDE